MAQQTQYTEELHAEMAEVRPLGALRPRKTGITRRRKIFSCKRCYRFKRRCSKHTPVCTRCARAKVPCEYFVPLSLESAQDHDKNVSEEVEERQGKVSVQSILNTEINPELKQTENENFTLIISSTGEFSRFFPTCIFPFHEHQENLSMMLNYNDIKEVHTAAFNFSIIVHPIKTVKGVTSHVPPKDISDILVNHFFKYVIPFAPIVDSAEFFYDYEKFWTDPNNCKDENFLVVLFAIYFSSCTNYMFIKILRSIKSDIQLPKKIVEFDTFQYRQTCFECIQNLKRMLNADATPSMSIIVALSLLYYIGSSNGFYVSVPVANLVKYSQIFGLHRSISSSSDSLPMRDIVYSFVWYMDGLSAYYSGLPPNMYSEFYQNEHTNLFKSSNISIQFFSGRIQNVRVWNRILFEFNKINKADKDSFENIEEMYLNSITIVNSINRRILSNPQEEYRHRKWLVTETRMGLRKSALLLSALRYSVSPKELHGITENITTDLVLQSMLLINESILKVKLGMEVFPEAIWFYRFAIPFQAMYIVLSHIQKYPSKHLNFSMLYDELEYTTDFELVNLDYNNGDLRMEMVDLSIETLELMVPFWHPFMCDRFKRIIEFRKFVYSKLEKSAQPPVPKPFSAISQILLASNTPQKTPDYEKSMPGLEDPNILVNNYTNAFEFLDEGSKFWFGFNE